MLETTAKPDGHISGVPSRNVDSGIELRLLIKWEPSITVENPLINNFISSFYTSEKAKEQNIE